MQSRYEDDNTGPWWASCRPAAPGNPTEERQRRRAKVRTRHTPGLNDAFPIPLWRPVYSARRTPSALVQGHQVGRTASTSRVCEHAHSCPAPPAHVTTRARPPCTPGRTRQTREPSARAQHLRPCCRPLARPPDRDHHSVASHPAAPEPGGSRSVHARAPRAGAHDVHHRCRHHASPQGRHHRPSTDRGQTASPVRGDQGRRLGAEPSCPNPSRTTPYNRCALPRPPSPSVNGTSCGSSPRACQLRDSPRAAPGRDHREVTAAPGRQRPGCPDECGGRVDDC